MGATLKEALLLAAKWTAALAVLSVIGLMLVLRLGRKRGTRSCRCRVVMWGVVVALVGTALTGSSCVSLFDDDDGESCYGFCPSNDISYKYMDDHDVVLGVPAEKSQDVPAPTPPESLPPDDSHP